MKLTRREKTLVQLLMAVIFLYIYFQWIILPQIDEYHKLKTQSEKYELDKSQNKVLLSSIEKIEMEYLTLDSTIKSITSKFFKTLDQESVIILLDGLLKDNDLDIPKFSYIPVQFEEVGGQKIKVLTVTFPFKGTYPSLIEFLKKIREYEHKIVVKNLNISITEDVYLTGDITLGFYSLPPME